MGIETHIIGVPGSGKTEALSRIVRDELLAKGVFVDDIYAVTFTVAAAREFVRRSTLPSSRVSTLHKAAFMALGLTTEEIAQSHLDEWSTLYPAWRITGTEDPDSWGPGDKLLSEVARYRGREVPPSEWLPYTAFFNDAWEEWKKSQGYLDFVDLIALAPVERFPKVRWLLVDEAQDFAPLEMRVIRRWAANANLVLAGDPNQSIYGWRGAGGAFDVQPNKKIILSRSYRLPAVIAQRASSLQTHPIPIVSVNDGGALLESAWNPNGFKAGLVLAEGGRLMFLGTARTFLEAPIMWAITEGIPFGNSFAPEVSTWNPLSSWCGVFTNWEAGRLTYNDLLKILASLPPRIVPHRHLLEGAIIERGVGLQPADFEWVLDYVPQWILEDIKRKNIFQLVVYMSDVRVSYPFRVYLNYGRKGVCSPHVIIGTVHSVKGGEADVVLSNFALTRAGKQAEREAPQEVRRLYYVALTRSRRYALRTVYGGQPGESYSLV